jgi:hypothetical protein
MLSGWMKLNLHIHKIILFRLIFEINGGCYNYELNIINKNILYGFLPRLLTDIFIGLNEWTFRALKTICKNRDQYCFILLVNFL